MTRRAIFALPLLTTMANSPAKLSMADDIARYVGFGVHRVGTSGEKQTANWLQKRLQTLGYNSRMDHFPVSTLLDPSASIESGSKKIAAFPQWNMPQGVLGKMIARPLLPLQAEAGPPSIRFIAKPLAFAPNWNASHDKLVADAVAKGASALILSIDIASGGLFACNQHSRDALPIPVLLVAKRDLAQLVGTEASLRITGKPVTAKALNVIGEKPGQGKRIVVSTPLTGWFNCGGERGPGIALWLRMARFLAKSSRPVTLIGSGSHEIGHLGMEHMLAHGAPAPEEVALWMHFGASLAATAQDAQYCFKSPQYLVGLPATEELAKSELLSLMPSYVTGDSKTQGEAGQIIGAGYRNFIGMSGMFPTFHTPEDHGQALDHAKLERIAVASEALLTRVQA
jgi:hypothetical protein